MQSQLTRRLHAACVRGYGVAGQNRGPIRLRVSACKELKLRWRVGLPVLPLIEYDAATDNAIRNTEPGLFLVLYVCEDFPCKSYLLHTFDALPILLTCPLIILMNNTRYTMDNATTVTGWEA